MKQNSPLFIRRSGKKFNEILLKYIVFEKNDNGLLLECEVKNGDAYHPISFCIDFRELNLLLGKIYNTLGLHQVSDLVSEHIFDNNQSICELDFTQHFGAPISLKEFSFSGTYHELKAA